MYSALRSEDTEAKMEFNLTIQFQMELKQCIQIGCCAKTLVFNFGLKNDFIFHLDKNLANVYIYIYKMQLK